MNKQILATLTGLIAAPIAATAQITTLSYEGDLMAGTSTYLPTGLISSTDGSFAPLPGAPVTGEFSASISVSGSLGANNLTLISYGVAFSGSNGVPGFSPNISFGPSPLTGLGGPSFCSGSGGGCINLTTSDGAITGATLDLVNSPFHAPQSTIDIGPTGDAFKYLYATTGGTCENPVQSGRGGPGVVYTGTSVNPCTVLASNRTPGEWSVTTSAPEIDPASAVSGLMLLFGGVAVLRGRRKMNH